MPKLTSINIPDTVCSKMVLKNKTKHKINAVKCCQTTVLVTQFWNWQAEKSPDSIKASASERVQHRNDELD